MLTRVYLLLSRLGVPLSLPAHAAVARAHYARTARGAHGGARWR
jgi:hypothetical protein